MPWEVRGLELIEREECGRRKQATPRRLPLASEDLARVSGHACLWYTLRHLLGLARAGDSYRVSLGYLCLAGSVLGQLGLLFPVICTFS